jgi:osmotically-inducible protein OsmY
MTRLLPIVAVAVLCACSRGGRVESPVTAAPPPADFAAAWDEVATGRAPSSQAEGLTVEKGQEGEIVVFRQVQYVAGGDAEEMPDDAALIGRVRGGLARNEKVDASFVDVSVDEGDVVLRGEVTSREEAAEVIRTALTTPGVDRVVARLGWTPLP